MPSPLLNKAPRPRRHPCLRMLPAVTLALLPVVTAAKAVNTGNAQCCTSIAPEFPPASYYGATIRRADDAGVLVRPFVPPLDDPPGSVAEMEQRVAEVAAQVGAVSGDLAAPLRGLAAAYLAQERYFEAIESLKRAVHIVRVNEGLHTPAQVELLEQLIGAHIRRGDYAEADAQQAYLFRVQSYGRKPGAPELREATLRYADWMRGAYLGDLDRDRFPRLVALNDLYEDAIENIEAQHGPRSRELLPYLDRRAQLSYLISVYPGEDDTGISIESQQMGQFELSGEAQLRFWRMQDHNFRYGLQALRQRVDILENDPQATARERADALVALADWQQWHRRYARAIRLYEDAWKIAEDGDEPEDWMGKTFTEPLELPRSPVFSPGVVPLGTVNGADVAMRFDVSRHGEAKDITILSEQTRETQPGITRAYHYLRNIRFRPRLADGTVVRAEGVERQYQVQF